MRKHTKIVSLLLVLATLVGVFAVLPGAPIVKASADTTTPESEPFTPTATTVEATTTADIISSVAGNQVSGIGLANFTNAELVKHYQTTTSSNNVFSTLHTLQSTSGVLDINPFLNVSVGGTKALNFNTGYYVIEADLASETEAINYLSFNAIIDFKDSASATRLDPGGQLWSSDMSLNDGNWHHYVIVGDLANNASYHFIDGKLVKTGVAYNASRKATQDAANANTVYSLSNVRIDINSGAKSVADQSVSVDNVAVRVLASDDSNLAVALANKDINSWSKAVTAPTEKKLPTVATVDGVEYSNVNDVTAQLNGNLVSKNVEINREYLGTITVNGSAIVETNGYTAPTAGANGELASTAGTVCKFSIVTATDTKSPSNSDIKNATTLSADSISVSDSVNAQLERYLVTDKLGNNTYLDIRPADTIDTSLTDNAHINWTFAKKTYESSDSIFIFEFDAYVDDSIIDDLRFYLLSRNSAAVAKYGTATYMVNLKLEAGTWSHVTVIGSASTADTYVYVNNKYIRTEPDGLIKGGYAEGDTIEGVRFHFGKSAGITSEQNFAIDNVSFKVNVTDSWLTQYVATDTPAQNLSTWNNNSFNSSYDLPVVPNPIACVDGEYVRSVDVLNQLLANGIDNKDVLFLRNVAETVTVNCVATVDTNGLNVTLANGDNVTAPTVNGNVYKYSEIIGSASQVAVDKDNFIVDTNVPGNLFVTNADGNKVRLTNNEDGLLATYIVTDKITGNTYLKIQPLIDGSTANTNPYISTEMIKAATTDANAASVLPKNQGYYVYDLDIATDGNIIDTMKLEPVHRDQATDGSFPFPTPVEFKNYDFADGEWMHLTIVGDMAANKQYVFINGTLVGEAGTTDYNNTAFTDINIKGFRMNLSRQVDISKDESILLDNICVRAYRTNDAAGDIAAAITAKSLNNWVNNVTTENTTLPAIAYVDGVPYNSVDQIKDATAGIDKQNRIEMLRDYTDLELLASGIAVLDTNGYSIKGVSASFSFANVFQNGNLYTVFAHSSSKTPTVDNSAIQKAIKHPNANNLLTFVGINCVAGSGSATGMGLTLITNYGDNNNTYLSVESSTDKDTSDGTPDTYFTLHPGSGNKSASVAYGSGTYYVFDMDFAVFSDVYNNSFSWSAITTDYSSGARKNVGGSGTNASKDFKNAIAALEKFTFHHVTTVYDFDANVSYTFLNGKLVATQAGGVYSATFSETSEFYLEAIRVLPNGQSDVAVDNLSIRKVTDIDTLKTAIESGKSSDWSEDLYSSDYVFPQLPNVATVDGEPVKNINQLYSALGLKPEVTVELLDVLDEQLVVTDAMTVITNGFTDAIRAEEGFKLVDNGNGTYTVTIETENGTIVVTINGNIAINAEVLKGTDIADYLYKNHAYVFDVIGANGKIYTGATWDTVPSGTVTGTHNYNVTATEYTGDLLVLDASGNEITVTRTEDDADLSDLVVQLKTSGNNTFIFGADFTLDLNAEFNVLGANELHLLGHTVTITNDALVAAVAASNSDEINKTVSYRLTLQSGAGKFSVIGGKIVDTSRPRSQPLFFQSYNFINSVNLIGVDFATNNAIAALRGGEFNIEDSTINASAGIGTPFQLAEYYGTSCTTAVVTLNITRSKIVCDSDGKTRNFIYIKDVSEWNDDSKIPGAEAAGYHKLPHRVNITYTTVNVDKAVTLVSSHNPSAEVLLKHSTVYGKTLFALPDSAQILLSDGVASNVPLGGTLLGNVKEVKSYEPVYSYVYSVDYATVTWNGENEEYWADGTIPSNPNAVNAPVSVVEAGKTYNFVSAEKDVEIKMNVTLGTSLTVNVYLPTASGVTAVTIGGVEMALNNTVVLNGTAYYKLSYDLLPQEASRSLDVVMTVDGKTYARTLSLIEYCEIALDGFSSDKSTVDLLNAILHYVMAAANYVDSYTAGIARAEAIGPNDVVIDDVIGLNAMKKLDGIITARSLNLEARPKWRLYVAEGTDLSKLTVTVGGKEIAYTEGDGFIEFELTADQMVKAVTVNYDGKSGRFDLKSYYDDVKAAEDAESTAAAPLVEAFYEYVYAAAQYKN